MTPEQLVPTLKTCEHLSRIGFPQDTHFCYNRAESFVWTSEQVLESWRIAAPTLQEIWQHLPQGLDLSRYENDDLAMEKDKNKTLFYYTEHLNAIHENPVEAAALLYIQLHTLSSEQSPLSPHPTTDEQITP